MFLYTVKAVIISDVPLRPASLKKESLLTDVSSVVVCLHDDQNKSLNKSTQCFSKILGPSKRCADG